MSKLAIVVGGCIFIALALIVLIADFNWIGALFLLAVGIGLLLFYFRR